MRRRGIVTQTLATMASQSSGYVIAILTGIVVARTLGPAGKGIASYASLVLALFTTLGNGLQAGVLHACGRRGAEQALVYGAALRLIGATMLPAALILLVAGVAFPGHAVLAFVGCAVPFAVYGQVVSGLFLLNDDVRTTIWQGAFNTFGVALLTIPALLIFHGGVTAVLAIWALMFGLSGTFAFWRLNAYLPAFSWRSSWLSIREQGWFSVKAGATSLASFLNLRIDVFIVSLMLDARTLGIYTLAVATGELMWQVSRPLAWTTTGRIAALDRESAIDLAVKVSRMTLSVEVVFGLVIVLLAPFAVRIVYGNAYAESGSIIPWLMPGLVLYAAQGTLGYYITVKEGRPSAILGVQSACVVLCATITALTIHRLGIFGAALATSVTYCFAAVVNVVLFTRFTGVSPVSLIVPTAQDAARGIAVIEAIARRLRIAPLRQANVKL